MFTSLSFLCSRMTIAISSTLSPSTWCPGLSLIWLLSVRDIWVYEWGHKHITPDLYWGSLGFHSLPVFVSLSMFLGMMLNVVFAMLCGLQDLSSPTRDWTHAHVSVSVAPLDCQRIPKLYTFSCLPLSISHPPLYAYVFIFIFVKL